MEVQELIAALFNITLVVMIVATMVVVANIVTDVTYALLDPRIRY